MKPPFFLFFAAGLLIFSTGCGEITYPKEKVRECVIELCDKEYKVDIDVNLEGNTLTIYLPLMHLFDVTLSLSEGAQEKIQDVLLGASRICLSTDAKIEFYCIIAQDIKLPEIQLVIIKYVDDVKRAFHHDISRGEYFKRTLIDMNENPQARKEKAIMEVFKKMELDSDLQNKVLDEFFRGSPSTLSGIGYWNGKFYVKQITLKEFLAEQMANRIRMRFNEEESLHKFALSAIRGKYAKKGKKDFFFIDFTAEPLLFIIRPDEKTVLERKMFKNAFQEVADTIYGYKFMDFDLVRIMEQNTNVRLSVLREDVYLFKKGKLGMDAILGGIN